MLTSKARLLLVHFEGGYRVSRLAWVLFRYMRRRPHEADFAAFVKFPERRGLFLDVGANVGQSALSFRLFNKSPILSIEPNPYHERDLRFIRRVIRDFDYRMCGAGDENVSLTLHVPTYQGTPLTGEASFSLEEAGKVWLQRHTGEDDVRALKMDEKVVEVRVLDDFHLAPAFVKIDVEGFELQVLRGLTATLEKHMPVILLERNHGYEAVRNHLEALGYRPFWYDAAREAFEPSLDETTTNVFFLPEDERPLPEPTVT